MFAYGIFKVIYSPFKAFKEILEKPKYIGPMLIMLLFVLANIGSAYVFLSKAYLDQTVPISSRLDEWTENCTLWASNVGTPECSGDHIGGVFYGNSSIEFSIVNGSQIWMQLNITDPLDCSGPEGYRNLSFRIKWNQTDGEVKPNNVTLYLFSTFPADYFYYDLTENFTESNSNVWNNLTIPLGSEKWANNSAYASWGNIESLMLEFTWPTNCNVTLLIDGLFFHGVFKSVMESEGGYLFNYSLVAFMQFTIQWVVLGGLLYIISKAFRAKPVWKTSLTIAGFALITLFVQALANAAAYANLPAIRYPLEMLGGVPGEGQAAFNQIFEATQLVFQITGYIQIAIHIWTVFLCAIAVRLLFEFSWLKGFLISALTYLLSILVMTFIMG